jgi:hypothetical protein
MLTVDEYMHIEQTDSIDKLSYRDIYDSVTHNEDNLEDDCLENDDINEFKRVTRKEALKNLDGVISFLESSLNFNENDAKILINLRNRISEIPVKKQSEITNYFQKE